MPCVFPILSLKALSLARAGIDERHARREGVAYTAGVVLTCVALGAIILALRAGGSAIGWAFQLQDPRMIVVLFVLALAIALNLAGLFQIPTRSEEHTYELQSLMSISYAVFCLKKKNLIHPGSNHLKSRDLQHQTGNIRLNHTLQSTYHTSLHSTYHQQIPTMINIQHHNYNRQY